MRLSFPLSDLTHALISLNAASEQLAGLDLWREQTAAPVLGSIDPQIGQEVPYAPSKRVGNPESVWAKFHFDIMMQNFHRMKKVASDPDLGAWELSGQEATRFFSFSDDVKQHVKSYHDLTTGIDYLVARLPATPAQLPALMHAMGKHDSQAAGFFDELAGYLPPAPAELFAALQAMGKGTVLPLREYGDFFKEAFATLPPPAALGPVFSGMLKEASRQGDEYGALQSGNDLAGRLLQAYYADKRGVPFGQMGLEPRAQGYFKEKGIFERMLGYFQELSNCPLRADWEGKVVSVTAADVLALYTSWYRKATIVEMVTPQFTGAAAAAATQFREFLDAVNTKTHGRLDLANAIEAESLERMRRDNGLLRRIGRLAMAMDAHGNTPGARLEMDSAVLLKFAKTLWTPAQRKKIWGSAERYVPDTRNGFESFRQDVATVLYATALNVGNHAAMLPGKQQERTVSIAAVKHLALAARACTTAVALQALVADSANAKAIVQLESDTMYMQQRPQQFNAPQAASGIRFINTWFGVEKSVPGPVAEAEMRKRLPGGIRDTGKGSLPAR